MKLRVALAAVTVLAAPIAIAGPVAAAPARFAPQVSPVRLLDTRSATRLVANQPFTLPEPSASVGAPVALSLNVAIVAPTAAGFATVHPCAQPPGQTSTVNFESGRTVANAVPIVPFTRATGKVCITSSAPAHAVVDLTAAFFADGTGAPVAVTPQRLLDSRGGGTAPRVAALVKREVNVPASNAYVGLTLVVTSPTAAGWAAVIPCNAAVGATSTVNFGANETVANLAFVDASAGVCVVSSVATHFVVDLVALPDAAARLDSAAPRRLLDTRDQAAWVGAGGLARLNLGSTRSAVLNVTAVEPTGAGFVNVWPCNQPEPGTSALSWTGTATVATAVTARVDSASEVCMRPSVGTHLLVDLLGFDNGPPATVTTQVTGRSNAWVIGTSVQGRPITARVYGSPGGRVTLGVGSIHGDEDAGLAIVEAIKAGSMPPGKTVWLIDSINPDGNVAQTRGNARGVDLNRNYVTNWRAIGVGSNYSGPAPSSEPETQAVLNFLRRVQPYASVWWHQVGDYVDDNRASVGRPDLEEVYVNTAAIGFDDAPCTGFCGGTATQHLNTTIKGSTNFVVELPSVLTATRAQAHANAFMALTTAA